MLYTKIICAIAIGFCVGYLRALYGSGILKAKFPKYGSIINKALQWVVIPLTIAGAIFLFAHGDWTLVILPVAVYLFHEAIGTGGEMQAKKDNTINNPSEFAPFDWLCHRLTEWVLKLDYDTWDAIRGNQPDDVVLQNKYCRLWGFFYATLIGIVFSLPFIFTGGIIAPLLWTYGYICREAEHRVCEFLLAACATSFYLLTLI